MLSGLSPGARLELVAASRSPSVVSVALQLPQAEPDGTARLTDKFPSTTTLWLILRKFESEPGLRRNFTARSMPLNEEQKSGSGRLVFETPVVTVLSRELASFTDLQKSLAQLGVNGGSILLRLNFRRTDTPLEDAMMEIEQYFRQSGDLNEPGPQDEGTKDAGTNVPSDLQPLMADERSLACPESQLEVDSMTPDRLQFNAAKRIEPEALSDSTNTSNSGQPVETIKGPSERPIAVFAPPISPTPKAALQKANDDDFEPTLDHVKSHQRYLQANSKNKTLKSDAELAAEAETKASKAAQIKEVEIKLRFPDQSQVSASFSNLDTAHALHEHATGLMRNPDEPIALTFAGARGRQIVPLNSQAKLIRDLGLKGRVLVEVSWGEDASIEARQEPTLKDQYRFKAQELPVKVIEGVDIQQDHDPVTIKQKGKEREAKKGGMPKWFKGIGKK